MYLSVVYPLWSRYISALQRNDLFAINFINSAPPCFARSVSTHLSMAHSVEYAMMSPTNFRSACPLSCSTTQAGGFTKSCKCAFSRSTCDRGTLKKDFSRSCFQRPFRIWRIVCHSLRQFSRAGDPIQDPGRGQSSRPFLCQENAVLLVGLFFRTKHLTDGTWMTATILPYILPKHFEREHVMLLCCSIFWSQILHPIHRPRLRLRQFQCRP